MVRAMDRYFLLRITSSPLEAEALRLELEERLSSGWEEIEKEVSIEFKTYFSSLEDAQSLLSSLMGQYNIKGEIKEIHSASWEREWKNFFQPIEVANTFLILPPWLKAPPRPIGKNSLIPLVIHPQMAFGTGHHPTTRLCLEALIHLREEGSLQKLKNFLDVGTGSSILSIAAVKLGLRGIGLDIDPLVRENVITNLRLNEIHDGFSLIIGSPSCLKKGPFDLIMANILLRPLMEMKQKLLSLLSHRGILVLSGILKEQEEMLISAYHPAEGRDYEIISRENWSCIIWKPGEP